MKRQAFYFGIALLLLSLSSFGQEVAKGVVFDDQNNNGIKERREKGIAGVSVTNGLQVVQTDEKGHYELPVGDDQIISVIKPSDYDVPVNDDQLPQFFYIHKPKGSPQLAYAGVPPTGPLPKEINFPLVKNEVGDSFKMILFGDPQVYTEDEVRYYEQGVIAELREAQGYAFGMSLGDLVGNRPDLFNPYIAATKAVGVPWYNVMGNHDINFDVTADSLSDESYEAHFGPATYAFNQGNVHFIVLDDIVYPDPRGGKGYWGGLSEQQLTFIANDLQYVPKDRLVVLAFHIPFTNNNSFRKEDRERLFKLLQPFPHTLSFSAHTHRQTHFFMTAEDGWLRDEPHHHYNAGTTSGNWYSGRFNEDGVPASMMADGTPKGYALVRFDGNQYQIDYKVAGKPADHQIGIYAPKVTAAGIKGSISIYANFYMGTANDTVMVRIGNDDWKAMKRVEEYDPTFIAERVAWDQTEEIWEGRKPGDPGISNHLWKLNIANGKLKPGVHTIEVKATDMFGQTFIEKAAITVR